MDDSTTSLHCVVVVIIRRFVRLVGNPECDLKAVGMTGKEEIDQTVRPIARSLLGWSGEATDRSKPSDNGPTFARVAPKPRGHGVQGARWPIGALTMGQEDLTVVFREVAKQSSQKHASS